MKLPLQNTPSTFMDQFAEFSIWITPALGEIRDTARFQRELDRVVEVFEALADATEDFANVNSCTADAITTALLKLVAGHGEAEALRILQGAASLLFLSTGKSDNNVKCQLPLHLRDAVKWTSYPAFKSKKGQRVLGSKKIPNVLKANQYMRAVVSLAAYPERQRQMLHEFVRFLLSDRTYVEQLWSIGSGYIALRQRGHARQFLTPLVVFQVRGSVSASGGHEPERRLRTRLEEWGLEPGVDYNLTDVKILPGGVVVETNAEDGDDTNDGDSEANDGPNGGRAATTGKTRAYDFVIPFKTPGWCQSVFIQSQFYAGDSGSVSHKNLDQVEKSRPLVITQNPSAYFIEYVDGAGYFASLKGDLRHLFGMSHTTSFAQVRSAPIRVRRAFQAVGFLTPLEVEHAVVRTDGSSDQVRALLVSEGYSLNEVTRGIASAVARSLIREESGRLLLTESRRTIVRRYLLLDLTAVYGTPLEPHLSAATGFLMVPGYGALYGVRHTELLDHAIEAAPGFASDLADARLVLQDIQWLTDNRFVMSS